MRYQLKQKLFAWGDDFTIRTDDGEDAFFVDGKVFTLGNQLSFQDMNGQELAFIRQTLLAWGPTYEIWQADRLMGVVKKQLFTFFSCVFTVDVAGPDDLKAEGDFLDHEYSITRQGGVVANVSKRWFALTDTYGVDIADDQDAVLILASTVVIDMACHADKRH